MRGDDEKGPHGKTRWIICGLLFAAIVLSYIDRLVIAVLKPDLSAQYGWSETGYAISRSISSSPTACLMSLPGGWSTGSVHGSATRLR